jgi:hypothetical protein
MVKLVCHEFFFVSMALSLSEKQYSRDAMVAARRQAA